MLNLVKIETFNYPVYINPLHVVSVFKACRAGTRDNCVKVSLVNGDYIETPWTYRKTISALAQTIYDPSADPDATSDAAILQVGQPTSVQHAVETDYYKLITEAVDRLLQLPKKSMLAAGLVYSDASDLGQNLIKFWFPVDPVNKKLAFVTLFQNYDDSYGCHCEVGDMEDASSTVFRKNVACRKDHAPTADDCSEEVAQNIYRGLIEVLARV